jgi:hypothetical protein
VSAWPDWMDDPAYLGLRAGDEDPGDLGLDVDPDDAPPPDVDPGELPAEAERISADRARAAEVAARLGLTAAMAADAVPGRDHGYARASRSDTSRLRLTCCSAASRTRRR